ncbi:Calcineurin-binding protein cabin-1, partial [Hondaea fermentalgiana]
MLRARWTAVNDPEPAPGIFAENEQEVDDHDHNNQNDNDNNEDLAVENPLVPSQSRKRLREASPGRPNEGSEEDPSAHRGRPLARKGPENVEIQEAKAARDYEAALALQVGGLPQSEQWTKAREIYERLTKLAVLESKQLKLGRTIKRCALANLASMDQSVGEETQALAHLVDAVCVDDSDPALWEEVARLSWKVGNLRLSRFAYEQALRGEWSVPPDSLWIGLLHVTYALADDAGCREAVRCALANNPQFAWAKLFENMLRRETSTPTTGAWPWDDAVDRALRQEEQRMLRDSVTLRRQRGVSAAGATRSRRGATQTEDERLEAALDAVLHGTTLQIAQFVDEKSSSAMDEDSDDEDEEEKSAESAQFRVSREELLRRASLAPHLGAADVPPKSRSRQTGSNNSTAEQRQVQSWISKRGGCEWPVEILLRDLLADLHEFDAACFASSEALSQSEAQAAAVSRCMDALAIADVDWMAPPTPSSSTQSTAELESETLRQDKSAIFLAEILFDWMVCPNIPAYIQQRCKRLALVCFSFARQRIPSRIYETVSLREQAEQLSLRLEWLSARVLALVMGNVTAATPALARCEALLETVATSGKALLRIPHLQFDAIISGDTIAAKREFLSWRRTIAQVKLEYLRKVFRRDPALAQRRLREVVEHYLETIEPSKSGLRQWNDFVMEVQMAESSLEDLHPQELSIESPELAQVETLSVLEECLPHASAQDKARFYSLVARLLASLVQLIQDHASQTTNLKQDCERKLLEQCLHLLADNDGCWEPEPWVLGETGWARIAGVLVASLSKSPDDAHLLGLLAAAAAHSPKCSSEMLDVLFNSLCACALEFAELLASLSDENMVRPNSLAFNMTGRVAAALLAAIRFDAVVQDEAFCHVASGCVATILQPAIVLCLRTHAKSKRGVTWASDVALWGLSALLTLCDQGQGTADAPQRRIRGVGLANMIKPLVKTFATSGDDRVYISLRSSAARLLASVHTIKALQHEDEDIYLALEEARQAILSDMLASLYGVIEFSDSPREDKRVFSGERTLESLDLHPSNAPACMPPRFLDEVSVVDCGPATSGRWKNHRSIVMRYLLNYLDSRAIVEDRECAEPDHTTALVRFILARSLLELGTDAPFGAAVRAFLETPAAGLSCKAEAVASACAFVTSRDAFVTTRLDPKPSDVVTAQELCERLPLCFAQLIENATPTKLPRLNAPIGDASLSDYCQKLETGLGALRLDLSFHPWRFMSWFKLGDLGSRLQRIAMSDPQVCSIMLDLLDAPAEDELQAVEPETQRAQPLDESANPPPSQQKLKLNQKLKLVRNPKSNHKLKFKFQRQALSPHRKKCKFHVQSIAVAQQMLMERNEDASELRAYDRVKANFRKESWNDAIVTRVNDDSTYDVCYENEDELDFALPRTMLKALPAKAARDEPENPDESIFDSLVTIGSFIFANLGCLRRFDRNLYQHACKLARDVFDRAILLEQHKKEPGVIFLHARALEKCACPTGEVLRRYEQALAAAPEKGDEMAICKTEVRYRIFATRAKALLREEESISGSSKEELQAILEGLSSCFGKGCERENHRAVYRFAATILESPHELLPGGDRTMWLEKAVNAMAATFEKKASERVCVIRYPEYTIKFDCIARPWWKMETTRFRHIRLYLKLCRALKDFKKARHFLSVLMDTFADRNKKDKDPNAATILRGACLCVIEMVNILKDSVATTAPEALLRGAFAIHVEHVDLLSALKSHPGLRAKYRLHLVADFLSHAFAEMKDRHAVRVAILKQCLAWVPEIIKGFE